MLLLNIDHVPGKEIEALGIVKGTVVQSKNFGKDFMSGMKSLVGGEITGYTEMLIEARQIATKRMVDEANALGADAIINIRYGSSSVMQGAAEVVAYARRIFDADGVIWQMAELGKVDAGGGGTVAAYMAERDIDTLDAGVPVLAMHSPFEVTGKLDCYMTYKACKAIYESAD